MKVAALLVLLALSAALQLCHAAAESTPDYRRMLGWKPTEASRQWQKNYLIKHPRTQRPTADLNLPASFDARFFSRLPLFPQVLLLTKSVFI